MSQRLQLLELLAYFALVFAAFLLRRAEPGPAYASPDGGFGMPNIGKLPVDPNTYKIIRARLDEAQRCLSVEAYMPAVILCGSVLETVLLGAARMAPEMFSRSRLSPKKGDKARPFSEWGLANLIDVAHDVGLLKADAQSFSHLLRNFRNYIHPARQMKSGFTPDRYTARLCFYTLKAALADLAGER